MNSIYTIAFYNLENLFDTIDNPRTLDNDFLPWGKKYWTEKKYQKKIYKLGRVIANIGKESSKKAPVLIGVSEVENAAVIEDLLESKHLKESNYNFVHYDSPDERGIDVALIVNEKYFEIEHTESISISIYETSGVKDYTRDALYVKGYLNNELTHVIVCHWPSRRDGAELTSHKRIQAAQQVTNFIESQPGINELSKIVIMGDFNDNPIDESIKKHLVTSNLFNPFEQLMNITRGSLSHYSKWHLFDQIIFSHNYFKIQKDQHSFQEAEIFDKKFLKEWEGRDKGKPFRTFKGRRYSGGYSDHFPVYINLKKT